MKNILFKEFMQTAYDRGVIFAKTALKEMIADNAIKQQDIPIANMLLRVNKPFEYGSEEYIKWVQTNRKQSYKPDPQKIKDVFGIVLNDLKK